MTDLTTLYRQLDALRNTRRQAVEDHEAAVRAFDREIADIQRTILQASAGLDTAAIKRGEAVLDINGKATEVRNGMHSDQNRRGVRKGAVESAKTDLARNSGARLAGEYVGVKNYDGFGDQREDHRYGMGPRHGSIVFRIGLQDDVRARLRDGGSLTPQEIEDALYLLTVLPMIEEAQKNGEAA